MSDLLSRFRHARRRGALVLQVVGLSLLPIALEGQALEFSFSPDAAYDDVAFPLTVSGTWFDSCPPGPHSATVDAGNKTIRVLGTVVGTLAGSGSSRALLCDEVDTPYNRIVESSLGPLPAGNWRIDYYTNSGAGDVFEGSDSLRIVSRPRIRFLSGFFDGFEGESVPITVVLTGESLEGQPITVQYGTADGSAVANADYTPTSGTLSWPVGDTSNRTFDVQLRNDVRVESDETVQLQLSNASPPASLASPSSATLTVLDTDVAPTADFVFAPTSPRVGDTVQFSDRSTGTVTSWQWTFGDGTSSSQQNPSKVYTAAGSYTVSLRVADASGTASQVTKTVLVASVGTPSASIQLDPASPVAGQSVQFFALSSDDVVSWQWAFGDGATSTLANPVHSYQNAGSYQVTLLVRNGDGQSASTQRQVTVQPPATGPVAAFDFIPTSPAVAQSVQFTDRSTGNPVSWQWSFGDTATSTLRDPTHAYATAGTYTVELLVTDAFGATDRATATIPVSSGSAPLAADFSFSPSSPSAGERVQFSDLSTGSPTGWQWSFGDGATSSEQSPSHAYRQPGTWLVELVVTDGTGASSSVERTVVVTSAPGAVVAAFDFSPESPTTAQAVQFFDRSTGALVSRQWSFGDGATSVLANPAHLYSKPGDYRVVLTVSDGQTDSTAERTIRVVEQPPVIAPPRARFTWSPLVPSVGETVAFSDRSTGVVSSWSWSFGDGATAAVRFPGHAWDSAGDYPVRLTVTGPGGVSVANATVTVEPRPVVELVAAVTAASESDGEVAVGVQRFGSQGAVSLSVVAAGGSAILGSDHAFVRQRLSWADGESGLRQVRIPLFDDAVREGPETLELVLEEVVGSDLGRRRARVVILDDEIPVGPEVTLTEAAAAARPAVASWSPSGLAESSRRQVVVWQQEDGDGLGVYAKLVDESGAETVPAFRVNERTAGDQWDPRVVIDGRGRVAVVWRESPAGEELAGTATRSTGNSLFGQFFDLDGNEESPEIEIGEGSPPTGPPSIAIDAGGELLVGWSDGEQVLTQPLGDDGPAEPPSVVGQGSSPEVARTLVGSYAVVWQGNGDGGSRTPWTRSGSSSLFGSYFDPSGNPVAGPTQIDEGDLEDPDTAAAGRDQYVVVWVRRGPDGDDDIFAKVVGADGNDRTQRFRVNADERGDERAPAVAVNGAGDFVVAWESDVGIFARFFDRRARPIGGDVWIVGSTPTRAAVDPDVTFDDRDRARVAWQLRRPDGGSDGIGSRVVSPSISGGCAEDGSTLCLEDERFEVRVEWRTARGASGVARVEKLSENTGYFWFFRDANVELLLKVLDGCALNGRYWVFAGGLTDVQTEIVVSDALTGRSRRYRSGMGQPFEPIQDTRAFDGCDASRRAAAPAPAADAPGTNVPIDAVGRARSGRATAPPVERAGGCVDNETRLCLADGRFAIEVDWETGTGALGSGRAQSLSEDTGYFWFFHPANVELVVKVLDGCGFNERYWVFAGGLTDVAVRWRVIDTVTGEVVEYENELGVPFRPVQDIEALSCR